MSRAEELMSRAEELMSRAEELMSRAEVFMGDINGKSIANAMTFVVLFIMIIFFFPFIKGLCGISAAKLNKIFQFSKFFIK